MRDFWKEQLYKRILLLIWIFSEKIYICKRTSANERNPTMTVRTK